ncbi:hypothetical protein QFZ79_001345 [Arthrobacter sp. V4I6]|nr:hypothetical protein [Arthrobacter sp. V1I7]MDQ0853234.1 hypothetical protein [Arthrobacter sp. V4I6]
MQEVRATRVPRDVLAVDMGLKCYPGVGHGALANAHRPRWGTRAAGSVVELGCVLAQDLEVRADLHLDLGAVR